MGYAQTPATPVAGSPGEWQAKVAVPLDGNWTAFFLDLVYETGAHFTTQMSVVPVAYPYGNCEDGAAGDCLRLV